MVKYTRWTQTAKDCYFRGCICKDCETFKLLRKMHRPCMMKKVVIDLVREIGRPERMDEDDL